MKLKTAFLKWQIKNSDQELPRNINLKKEIALKKILDTGVH